MNSPITDYNSLLLSAKEQPEPQRLLFVFLQVSVSNDAKNTEKKQFDSGQGGELQPIMCVDKTLDELERFPDSTEAEQPLNMMIQAVEQGSDLSKYLAFNKQGKLIQFS